VTRSQNERHHRTFALLVEEREGFLEVLDH
jgi:hypothetical protein